MVQNQVVEGFGVIKGRRIKKKTLSKRKLIRFVSVVCFLLPRTSLAYPFYLFPTVFGINYKARSTNYLFLFLLFCTTCIFISSLGTKISTTAFLLSLILQFPFFAFLFGFELKERLDGFLLMRLLNVFTLILSVLNMTKQGFPLRLPYKDFLPDFYAAFYGAGGAKIITMIGFFGLASEMFAEKRNMKFLVIAALNFVVPNYLSGLIVGVGALTMVAIRKNIYLMPFIGLMALIVAPYAEMRFHFLNDSFSSSVGYNPKLFAYISIGLLFYKFPLTLFTGTGLGQFTSTPALWASQYISALSTHDIPNLPGLNMSTYHAKILGPFLSVVSDNSIRSSANKPYTSLSTIVSEYGILLTIVICILFYRAFKKMDFSKKFTLAIFLFTCFIFTIDLWHDSFWYGYLLILSADISKKAI